MNKSRNLANRSVEAKSRIAATKRSLEKPMVRIMGDFAIINGIHSQVLKDAAGAETTSKTFYPSVWAKRKGVWQCIHTQYTSVKKENWDK